MLDLPGLMIVLRILGRHDRTRGKTSIDQALVVDPLLLRVLRMTTGLVLLSRLTLTVNRSVLGLIRSFHGMEEPAGVPSARCKTSLASAYGLMSEVSPAFTLPASPLVRSLLDDTNLALAKFLEDQPASFCLCPVAGIEGIIVPPLPLFLGRIQSHLALPRSHSRKLVRLRNALFLCPTHRSPRWSPCFLGCARSRHGWTGGCRPAGVSETIFLPKFVPTSRG